MHWSWEQLLATPDYVVERVLELMTAEDSDRDEDTF
jgi:hypothetical protein